MATLPNIGDIYGGGIVFKTIPSMNKVYIVSNQLDEEYSSPFVINGYSNQMNYFDAESQLLDFNHELVGGYGDWKFGTAEELISLFAQPSICAQVGMQIDGERYYYTDVSNLESVVCIDPSTNTIEDRAKTDYAFATAIRIEDLTPTPELKDSPSFNLVNEIKIVQPIANIDYFYGTYNSIEEALFNIPISIRQKGRTVGININNKIVEYWWKNGITDNDLEIKIGTVISFGYGEKKTGIHSGKEFELSVTDDYLYICVQPGDEKNAIWKKIILFQT